MAGVSHVLDNNPVNMCMRNYTSDYSFGIHAGIVYLIEFKLVCFELTPSLSILHFRISAGRMGYVSLRIRNILNHMKVL